MRLDIYPSFISQEEINALNEWVNLGVINKWLDTATTMPAEDWNSEKIKVQQ